jgi:hypothetical protein
MKISDLIKFYKVQPFWDLRNPFCDVPFQGFVDKLIKITTRQATTGKINNSYIGYIIQDYITDKIANEIQICR